MGEQKPIYQKKRQLESTLESIEKSEKISSKDKTLLKKFKKECESQGLSPARIQYYFCRLKPIAENVKELN